MVFDAGQFVWNFSWDDSWMHWYEVGCDLRFAIRVKYEGPDAGLFQIETISSFFAFHHKFGFSIPFSKFFSVNWIEYMKFWIEEINCIMQNEPNWEMTYARWVFNDEFEPNGMHIVVFVHFNDLNKL